MKRFSVAIGSFLVLILSSIGFGWDTWVTIVYAGVVNTGSMILMSLFGKNGNGQEIETKETTPTEDVPT